MTQSLYWYDFEAGGANPRADRPTQFAGIRTDLELNIIGEPLVAYCQLSPDYLPHPQACLITGITPQLTQQKGLLETDLAGKIHEQFATPETTIVGYNNIRFDDEMTRFMFYRNFLDPYAYSWQHNNSRWDIVDLVRACYALRPEGINWPQHDTGLPSFKLEQLSVANDIEHGQAHDAMSDVYATIGMAKLIKTKQPRLYQYFYERRRKQAVQQLIDDALINGKPLAHVQAGYGSSQGNICWVLPLAYHPQQGNQVIAWRLDKAPQQWLQESPEAIRQLLYMKGSELGDTERPGLVTITINQCPFIAPAGTLSPERAEHFGLSWQQANNHAAQLLEDESLRQHLLQVFEQPSTPSEPDDVDFQLYSGAFFSDQAKSHMQMIRQTPADKLATLQLDFDDARMPEMLFRYRARNYPATLSDGEQRRWREFCKQRLTDGGKQLLSIEEFALQLEQLVEEHQQNDRHLSILKALFNYVQQL